MMPSEATEDADDNFEVQSGKYQMSERSRFSDVKRVQLMKRIKPDDLR